MADNKRLHNAKKNKNDEFYTQLSVIEEELRHYKQHFKGKIVFCNCDDPYESNFFKYFSINFNSLGLKKLIATGYSTSPILGTELDVWTGEETAIKERVPYVAYINEVKDMNGDGRIDLEDVKILLQKKHNCRRKLYGDKDYSAGDFRSKESIKLLKQADIVVTNPPFSLFREYVHQLVEYDKKFIIMGNKNAITYKEFFPLLKNNKVWVGATSLNGGRWMVMPKGMKIEKKDKTKINDRGETILNVAGVCWFTNLDIKKRHENLILYKHYNNDNYPTYDNLDGINVDNVVNIPCDYTGIMGVPITFLDKYNPDQFEILGLSRDMDLPTKIGMRKEFLDDYFSQGGTGSMMPGHPDLGYYDNDGNAIVPYRRIMIKRR